MDERDADYYNERIASLKAALREALIRWELCINVRDVASRERIRGLRKEFLE